MRSCERTERKMYEFVYSLLNLMITPFRYSDLSILGVPFGFGVVCALFALIRRLGGFDRV